MSRSLEPRRPFAGSRWAPAFSASQGAAKHVASASLGTAPGRRPQRERNPEGGRPHKCADGEPAPAQPELPLLHRLAIVYLMAPVAIWLVGWFEWWFGIPAAALIVCALRHPLSGSWRPRAPSAAEAAGLAGATLWVMVTAAGGLADIGNHQWTEHRATLLDLGRYPWPTYLPDPLVAWRPAPAGEAPATPPLLRYYLGWFMVPGLVAHWFGPAALRWAVALWTWAGVALIALLFTRRRRGREVVIALMILIFFSGMNVVSVLVLKRWVWIEQAIDVWGWQAFPLYEPVLLTVVSGTRTLMNAPQHYLPAGLYALLCLQLRRQPRFPAVLGVLLAAAPFWSAFVAVGLLPLLAVVVRENGVRPFLRWPNLCLAGPLFGVVALYLTSGPMDFPHGWAWEREGYDWLKVARRLPVFYLTEFLLLVLVLLAVRPALRREPFFIASVATLLLLPLYFYGTSNDLLLRASQPALFLLSWFCAEAVARRGGAIVRSGGGVRRAAFAGLVLVLGVGALSPAAAVVWAVERYGVFRYEHARATTLVDLPRIWQRQNVAREVPDLLRWWLREPAAFPERRLPSEPVIRSVFDVYLDDGRLIYVKDRCTPADMENTIFFLKVIPMNPDDLPWGHRRRKGFQFEQLRTFSRVKVGGRCLVAKSLPKYPVARIVTGQDRPLDRYGVERQPIWRAEATLGGG